MKRDELIDAFEMGDMGDVEFTELALEAGMTIDEISIVLAKVKAADGEAA